MPQRAPRRGLVLGIGSLILLASGCATTHTTSAESSLTSAPAAAVVLQSSRPAPRSDAPTERTATIVLRPVTGQGTAAPGYQVESHRSDQIDCTTRTQSPVAVTGNVSECSPTALNPLACWAGPGPGTALCYLTALSHRLFEYTGTVPATVRTGPASPMRLVLADGASCDYRVGGAWAGLDGHPELAATYGCSNGQAVWTRTGADSVDRSAPIWRVEVAPESGHGALTTATVSTAYFVGTAT